MEIEFEPFFAASLDLMAIATLEGFFTVVNPAFSEKLGWTADELCSQPFINFLHPDDVAPTAGAVTDLGEGGNTYSFQNRYRCSDDSYRWIEWNASSRGDLIYAIGRDITESKRTQNSLAEALARLQSMFDTVMSGIIVIDENGTIESVNSAGERLFGYQDAELVGRNVNMLMPEPYHSEHDGYLERYRRTDEPRIIGTGRSVHGKRKDGTTFPLELAVSEIEFGEHRRFTGVTHDMTDHHAAIEEASMARAAAETANQAKSEFLSRVSHELRTPLNAIMGFAQLIESNSAEDRESTAVILKASKHLLAVIDDVLDISRMETGELSLSLEPVALEPIVEECVDLLNPRGTGSQLDLVLDCGSETHVLGDRQRIRQVILNLLSNALKYGPVDGRVTVKTTCVDRLTKLSITDQGTGIPADRIGDLFTPFDRLGAENTEVEGTGLGLSLSASLIETMNGVLGVDSPPGQGATFWFTLPTAPRVDHAELETGDDPRAVTQHVAGTVLYIEDNPSNLRLMQRIFERRPLVNLLTSIDGRSGFATALSCLPDLILLDLNLPGLTGDQVLERLRAEPTTENMPVIVVSADANPGRIHELRDNGAQEFITKPVAIDEILELIDQYIPNVASPV